MVALIWALAPRRALQPHLSDWVCYKIQKPRSLAVTVVDAHDTRKAVPNSQARNRSQACCRVCRNPAGAVGPLPPRPLLRLLRPAAAYNSTRLT